MDDVFNSRAQHTFMTRAYAKGMTSPEYVVIYWQVMLNRFIYAPWEFGHSVEELDANVGRQVYSKYMAVS